jgi:hypothetical protein
MNGLISKKIRFTHLLTGIVTVFFTLSTAAFAASKGATPCSIQLGSCTARTSGGITVEFDVQPKPVTAMSELTFVVRLSRNGAPVTDAAVQVDLTMPGMFMGTTRPMLEHVGKGRYEGKGMLMRCASGRKTWQADVLMGEEVHTVIAGFVFEVR